MADPLYLALAILAVAVGTAISIPLARRSRLAATSTPRHTAPTVALSDWATPLGLSNVGPGEDARFPQGLLRGSRGGHEVQVFESSPVDEDGSPSTSFVSVLVFGNDPKGWATVLSRRQANALGTRRPALACHIETILERAELTVAVGRVLCNLPLSDRAGRAIDAQTVDVVLTAAIALANHFDG